MDTNTLILILIAVAVLIVAVGLIWIVIRRANSEKLRQKFGPEYDYTLEKEGDRRTAEEALKEREKRVNELDIRDLDSHERDRYHTDWIEIQAEFVDNPSKSVDQANQLITEVMIVRGFPVDDFEHRAADISVVYPDLVSNYRNAYTITVKSQNDGTSTEELRQAMVYYRSLFDELLGVEEIQEKESI
jgi:hypothetical protein